MTRSGHLLFHLAPQSEVYDQLYAQHPSPVVALNRTVALSMLERSTAALSSVDELRSVLAGRRSSGSAGKRSPATRRIACAAIRFAGAGCKDGLTEISEKTQ